MPSDYECEKCGLNFTVGWYHYHRTDTGYGARTLLVCTSCGVVNSIEHPVKGASVVERLQVQKKLLVRPAKFSERINFYKDWIGSEVVSGRKLQKLSCLHCGSAGTLRKDWPLFGAECPGCRTIISKPRQVWRT